MSLDKLVAVDQLTRRFTADVYYAVYDSNNQWYYQSAMKPSEGVLFKSWDTDVPGSGGGTTELQFKIQAITDTNSLYTLIYPFAKRMHPHCSWAPTEC